MYWMYADRGVVGCCGICQPGLLRVVYSIQSLHNFSPGVSVVALYTTATSWQTTSPRELNPVRHPENYDIQVSSSGYLPHCTQSLTWWRSMAVHTDKHSILVEPARQCNIDCGYYCGGSLGQKWLPARYYIRTLGQPQRILFHCITGYKDERGYPHLCTHLQMP